MASKITDPRTGARPAADARAVGFPYHLRPTHQPVRKGFKMGSPDDRRYLQSHEWHKLEGGVVSIGISQFAVDELTDITYLELSKTSGAIRKGESFGEIESVKATSELYCGLDGEIVEVNQEAIHAPESINGDPYGAWLIKVKPANPADVESLLSAADYDAITG